MASLFQAFVDMGFASPQIVESEGWLFAVYPKFTARKPNLIRCQNGNFLFVCGTCLSEHGVGVPGAFPISHGSDASGSPVMGHYAVVARRGEKIYIQNDPFGAYNIFFSLENKIISSSFYSISLALKSLTLQNQSVYEYVFNGVISGDDTLFREVALLPILGRLIVRGSRLELRRETPSAPEATTTAPFSICMERSIGLLDQYFRTAVGVFGNRIGSALSGGFDSRLVIASLRRHGAAPRVYVYGTKADKDVQVAAAIARGEGLLFQIIDKDARPNIPPSHFAAVAHRNFLAADGYSYPGIFHNGAEIDESTQRVSGSTLAFNGGGGEIFRNFFYLRDRSYQLRELLYAFYSQFESRSATATFNVEDYYARLEDKIYRLLGSSEGRLSRVTIEWLYHNFRCRSWDGRGDSIASRFGYTAMPFLERCVTEHASTLPLRWKNHGAYEARLIERIDKRLAAYPSIYGHTFAGEPPLTRRLRDCATYLRPPWLRRYTHWLKYGVLSRQTDDRSGYLASAYREVVLPGGPEVLRRFFRLDRIRDDAQYQRILSLEYAVRQFGSRVKLDF